MNRLLTAMMIASLTGLAFSGPATAGPGFIEEAWILAHKGGNPDRGEERDLRKLKQRPGKKKPERVEDEQEDRGYGYGYERRNPDKPERVYDDRGRR